MGFAEDRSKHDSSNRLRIGKVARGPVRRSPVTAAEVAAQARVSVSTVSLVLNRKDKGRARARTRARVLKAVENLGYVIDRRGRSLATGRTGIVGFVAPDVSNPFFGLVQMGMLCAFGPDYQVLTIATELGQSVTRETVDQLLALAVDGLILATVDVQLSKSLPPSTPVIVLDSPGQDLGRTCVNLDVESGARALAQHLLENGHRIVAYLEADTKTKTLAARREAFVAALKRGSPDVQTHLAYSQIFIDSAAATVTREWEAWRGHRVTAVVCATDLQAYGALTALRTLGVSVPAEVSVAGADDLPTSAIIQPALTTVHLPAYELGRIGAEQMRRLMEDPDHALGITLLPTELRIRESTGRAATLATDSGALPRALT